VGHDKNLDASQQARKLGAVQRTEWNLHSAWDDAQLVILAVPLSELSDLLGHLRDSLSTGALVFIAVDMIQPALDLARQLLPPRTHVVAGHPILTGVGGTLTPRPGLFDEITFCLAAGVETAPQAMQMASDLVERVGARPLFVDAHEHDGLIAGVEQLPQLVAAALVQMSTRSTGWREGRRLAGRRFAQSTELGDNAAQLFDAWQSNRENLLLRLTQLRQTLADWQELLSAEADAEGHHPLQTALEQVVHDRLEWEGQAMLKAWDEAPRSEKVESRNMFQQMFFGGLMGRRGAQDTRKEKR
jgi:prephenate dehydrogenase